METTKFIYYICEYRYNGQRNGFVFKSTSFDNAYKQIRQWTKGKKETTIIAIREAFK